MWRRVLTALVLAVLGGCAVLAPTVPAPADPAPLPAIASYLLEGRFAVSGVPQPVSGKLSWQHDAGQDRILLQDPFGRGLAEIELAASGAILRRADAPPVRAATAAALARRLFDLDLPLDALAIWLTARLPAVPDKAEHDPAGRLSAWRLADWEVRYDYAAESPVDALPERVSARRDDGVAVRVRIDRWDLAGAR